MRTWMTLPPWAAPIGPPESATKRVHATGAVRLRG